MSPETQPPTSSRTADLATRVFRGAIWTTGGFAIIRALRLISNLVLTRLLFPEAFGVMLLLNVIMLGLGQLSDLGLRPSVVRSDRGEDPEFLDTAWTIQVFRGLTLWVLATAIAWPAATFYDEPSLTLYMPVAAFSLVLNGFQSSALMVMSRRLEVGRLMSIELTSNFIRVPSMLLWAWLSPSIWALVGGGLIGSIVTLVLSHLANERRDRFRFEGAATREIVHFGKWIFLSTILSFSSEQLDRIMFGKMIPMTQLGVYSVAVLFATIPSDLMTKFGSAVIFPALSEKQHGDDLVSAYNRARTPLLLLCGLGCLLLASSGEPLVTSLYDDRYREAGWILQILALGTWLRILEVPPGCAMLAVGESRVIALGHAAKVASIAALVPYGFSAAEFPGALAGLVASQLPLYAVVSGAARTRGFRSFLRDLGMTVSLFVSTGIGLTAADLVASRFDSSWVVMIGSSLAAAAAWVVVALVLMRRDGQDPRRFLQLATRRQPAR